QRDLLALAELRRVGEVQEIVVLLLGEPFPSGLDGALHASVLALDRLRHVDAAELLDRVVAESLPERELPRLRERADHAGIIGADRLALRPRRALVPGALEVAEDLRIRHRRRIDVGNVRHGMSLLENALAAEAALPARDDL